MQRSEGTGVTDGKVSKRAVPWWGWLALVITVAVSAIAYTHLPVRVATHFDASGQPNAYGPRWVDTFLTPGLMLVLALLWNGLWRIDPKRTNYPRFWPTYRYLGGAILVFLGLIELWTIGKALQWPIASVRGLPAIVGVLIVLLANLLPRIQPNWWLGVRTPWTLSSEVSWRKTHRLAGQLGLPAGVLMIVCSFVLPLTWTLWAILGPIVLWGAVITTASYFYAQ